MEKLEERCKKVCSDLAKHFGIPEGKVKHGWFGHGFELTSPRGYSLLVHQGCDRSPLYDDDVLIEIGPGNLLNIRGGSVKSWFLASNDINKTIKKIEKSLETVNKERLTKRVIKKDVKEWLKRQDFFVEDVSWEFGVNEVAAIIRAEDDNDDHYARIQAEGKAEEYIEEKFPGCEAYSLYDSETGNNVLVIKIEIE